MRQMLLHTEAFEHRCLSTQKHLPRDALTYTRLCTQKLLDTDCFSENHRSFDTEKPLHRESFTHRSFYTHKLFHRSFYTEKLLSTGAFTHRRLYTQKLVHTEAFTHRSFYTEKPLHTDAFPQKNRFHREALPHVQKIAILRKFLTFGHHIVRKGCIRRWKIAIFDVAQSFCVKWVAPDLVKSHFYTSFISRETVVPDDPKWIKSQFYTNSWTFASDVKKSSVFPQLLPFSFHATLASELSKYTSFWWLTLISCEGAAPGPAKFAFCHVFGCPTCAISVSADGCCGPKDKQDPHFTTRLGIRHAAEGNVS